MAFKAASQKQNYMARVASSSIRGKRNCHVDTLPVEARPWEAKYQDLLEQYRSLKERVDQYEQVLKGLNQQIKGRHPRDVHELTIQRAETVQNKAVADSELGVLKKLISEAAGRAYTIVFYQVANAILPHAAFRSVDEQVRAIMQRPYPFGTSTKVVSNPYYFDDGETPKK